MDHAWKDPVVEETRERGRSYTKRLGDDVHRIFEDLRQHQREHEDRYVTPVTAVPEDPRRRSPKTP
jgi:hypothetical protein